LRDHKEQGQERSLRDGSCRTRFHGDMVPQRDYGAFIRL
jgi:hypothetical protein